MPAENEDKSLYDMEEIRLLSKEDIDVRVAQTNSYKNNGLEVVKCNLLLYKNARVDMKIMDELFTPMGWKRTHKLIGDRLYCQVEVWDKEKKEWICKEDVGVESNTEAEKGQASDSFKRACVNWGIGRELYTAPKVSIELNDKEYTKGQDGKIRVWATFSVKSIGYDNASRTITSLEIQDRFGNVRFTTDNQVQQPQEQKQPTKAKRPARGKAASYEPLAQDAYWKVIAAYAQGKPTKTGGDYKETWIATTHAGAEQILQFDCDVENYKLTQEMELQEVRRSQSSYEEFI